MKNGLSPADSLTVLASNLKSYRTLTVLYLKIKNHEMTTDSNIKEGLSKGQLPARLDLWHMPTCKKEPGRSAAWLSPSLKQMMKRITSLRLA